MEIASGLDLVTPESLNPELQVCSSRITEDDVRSLTVWLTTLTPIAHVLLVGMICSAYRHHPESLVWQLIRDMQLKTAHKITGY